MSMSGYTKLFNSILASTIWRESHTTRIVWITLLAMADKHGVAEGSVPGLADFARVSISECRKALAALMSPDEDSRSKEYEGRRVAAIEGGWQLLNHAKYRQKMGADERREYLRQKQADYRKRLSTKVNNVSDTLTVSTHTEAEAYTEAKAIQDISSEPSKTDVSEPFVMAFEVVGTGPKSWSLTQDRLDAWTDAYPGIDVYAECKKARAWLDANPTKRKTAKGMAKFLNGWIARSVDGGKATKVPSLPKAQPTYASDWYEECQRLHNGECDGQYKHGLRMAL